MSKQVTGKIVAPDGTIARYTPPEEMANANLREQVSMMRELLNARRGQVANSLTGLAASYGSGNMDNITSMMPMFTSNIYAPITVNFTLLSYLYKTHGILQTMIDEPVLDAFRDGIELTSREMGEGSVGKSGLGELEDFAEETGAWEELKFMLQLGGLYGGAGLVINAGQDPEKPLDEKDIRRGRLEFYAADRWEFSGTHRTAKTFLFYGQKLDATRVLTYAGKRAPRLLRATLNGWGMSEMERTIEDFNMWLRGRNVLYEILDEAKVDVYGIKDYASTLLTPDGEATMRKRLDGTNRLKNFHNALILDKEDDYKVISNSFTGLADVMRENRIGIACATRIPFSKLFGTTATGGLGNSGEDDMENYNAMITSRVRSPARPIIRKMLRMMMIACWGKEYDISFEFKPLRVLSAKDQADIDDKLQLRFERLYDKRILDSKELGELLHKHKLISIETKAQRGLLPMNPEVPTTEQMFADKGEKNDDEQSDGDVGGDGSEGAGDGDASAG